jgi:hypothetical protein
VGLGGGRAEHLVALTRVPESDAGVAASLLNVGRQVGGAIGLAVRVSATGAAEPRIRSDNP